MAAPRWWSDHAREVVLIVASALLVGILAVQFDLFEVVDGWLLETFGLDRSELDELLFVSAVVSVGGSIFAFRRWRELREALVARERAEAERADTERQLQQARRLEALGRIAGGVAHDFNNLLTVILGFSDIVLRGLERGSPLREPASEVRRAGETAARLTRQLLEFSRKSATDTGTLQIDELLADMRAMLDRVVGADVRLELRAGAPGAQVGIGRGQLEQVVLNLVMNAREAMPAGGRLVVSTALVDVTAATRDAQLPPPLGRCLALAVTDTGLGMDADTLERVFEPFFSTKTETHGTGLGLATVYGIVRQCGGGIRIESARGGGTTVTVHLPIAAPAAATGAVLAPVRPVIRIAERGSATVLLVEDNDAVRTLLEQTLEKAGHRVLVAVDGLDGLEVAARHAGTIDVVVSDLVMPRLNGAELASLLRRRRPDVRFVYMTGYAGTVLENAPALGDVPVLAKPFHPSVLLHTVREELERAKDATVRASETMPRAAHGSRG